MESMEGGWGMSLQLRRQKDVSMVQIWTRPFVRTDCRFCHCPLSLDRVVGWGSSR